MKRTFGRFSNPGLRTTTGDVLIPALARECPIGILRRLSFKSSVTRSTRIAGSLGLRFSEACITNTGWRKLPHDPGTAMEIISAEDTGGANGCGPTIDAWREQTLRRRR